MKTKKSLLVFAILFAIATAGVYANPTQEGEATAAPSGEVQYGGTLTYGMIFMERDMDNWDPCGGSWTTSPRSFPFQESLLSGDMSKGMTGSGEHRFVGRYIGPDYARGELMESWELSQNPLRLVFHIREGVHFYADHVDYMDSRELTAQDVAYSIQRRIDTSTTTSFVQADAIQWEFIESITTPDKYTVVLELSSLYPDWMYQIGWGAASNVYPPELEKAGFGEWRNLVGTGPFYLSNYITGSSYEYTKNPNYWDTTVIDGKEYQLPFIDKLVLPIIKDYGVRAAALRTGKIDAITHFPWNYHESLMKTTGLRYWAMNAEGYPFVAPRFDVKPFDDIRVRAALSMAIDRDYIIDALYGGYGVIDNFTYAKEWGPKVHTPLDQQPKEVQEYYSYNPERAKELLAEAGIPDGFECEIDFDNSRVYYTDLMSLIKDYWNDIGINLTLKPHDTPTQKGTMRARSQKDMHADYADAATPAMGWVGDFRTGGEANHMGYSNARADDLFMQWTVEQDIDRQNALLKEISNIVIADLAHICLPSPNQFIYAWQWVRNFEGETTTKYRSGVNAYSIVWIDQELKKSMGY